MESPLPLAEVVAEVAVKAALDDPRFLPLSPDELDQVILEVSILSPMARVHSKNDIHVGEHGLVLELGTSKGVLLPQVATEYGWNVEEFLEAVCRKSGLPPSAWEYPDARISVFSAEIIDEEHVLREHPASP
jgi:AmmeMemoRadiSam system protein A